MHTQEPIVIVGAGFAGIGMAVELMNHGIEDFVIYEKSDALGGTWRDNTYPGCACDVPSHVYSYSFEQNPGWSRAYSPQPEILDYMEQVARKHAVYPKIRFGIEVTAARLDEDRGVWEVEFADGETAEARMLILGVGVLARPKIPTFEGLSDYRGETWHSAEWNHEFALEGRRVGVVGTGASAIQFVPAIADTVGELALYQRTPPWVVPKPDRVYSALERFAFEHLPGALDFARKSKYWLMEALATGFVVDPRLVALFEMRARRHLRRCVEDPELRQALTPEFRMGCKRVLFSDDYYPAVASETVELVTDEIERFSATGIVDATGREREHDAVIFGTGFHVTDFLSHFEVVGRDGRELNACWREGAEAYLGVSVSGFPNLFMLVGPNTGLGHSSIIFMIESQAHMIRQAIERVRAEDAKFIDVRPSTQRHFNDSLQKRLDKAIWQSGCESWYLDENGKNTTLWPGYTFEYWWKTRRLDDEAFRLSWG